MRDLLTFVSFLVFLSTVFGGRTEENCPCLPRDKCPRIYGQSATDIRELGFLKPCQDYGTVRCCGVTIRIEHEKDVERVKLPGRSENYGMELHSAESNFAQESVQLPDSRPEPKFKRRKLMTFVQKNNEKNNENNEELHSNSKTHSSSHHHASSSSKGHQSSKFTKKIMSHKSFQAASSQNTNLNSERNRGTDEHNSNADENDNEKKLLVSEIVSRGGSSSNNLNSSRSSSGMSFKNSESSSTSLASSKNNLFSTSKFNGNKSSSSNNEQKSDESEKEEVNSPPKLAPVFNRKKRPGVRVGIRVKSAHPASVSINTHGHNESLQIIGLKSIESESDINVRNNIQVSSQNMQSNTNKAQFSEDQHSENLSSKENLGQEEGEKKQVFGMRIRKRPLWSNRKEENSQVSSQNVENAQMSTSKVISSQSEISSESDSKKLRIPIRVKRPLVRPRPASASISTQNFDGEKAEENLKESEDQNNKNSNVFQSSTNENNGESLLNNRENSQNSEDHESKSSAVLTQNSQVLMRPRFKTRMRIRISSTTPPPTHETHSEEHESTNFEELPQVNKFEKPITIQAGEKEKSKVTEMPTSYHSHRKTVTKIEGSTDGEKPYVKISISQHDNKENKKQEVETESWAQETPSRPLSTYTKIRGQKESSGNKHVYLPMSPIVEKEESYSHVQNHHAYKRPTQILIENKSYRNKENNAPVEREQTHGYTHAQSVPYEKEQTYEYTPSYKHKEEASPVVQVETHKYVQSVPVQKEKTQATSSGSKRFRVPTSFDLPVYTHEAPKDENHESYEPKYEEEEKYEPKYTHEVKSRPSYVHEPKTEQKYELKHENGGKYEPKYEQEVKYEPKYEQEVKYEPKYEHETKYEHKYPTLESYDLVLDKNDRGSKYPEYKEKEEEYEAYDDQEESRVSVKVTSPSPSSSAQKVPKYRRIKVPTVFESIKTGGSSNVVKNEDESSNKEEYLEKTPERQTRIRFRVNLNKTPEKFVIVTPTPVSEYNKVKETEKSSSFVFPPYQARTPAPIVQKNNYEAKIPTFEAKTPNFEAKTPTYETKIPTYESKVPTRPKATESYLKVQIEGTEVTPKSPASTSPTLAYNSYKKGSSSRISVPKTFEFGTGSDEKKEKVESVKVIQNVPTKQVEMTREQVFEVVKTPTPPVPGPVISYISINTEEKNNKDEYSYRGPVEIKSEKEKVSQSVNIGENSNKFESFREEGHKMTSNHHNAHHKTHGVHISSNQEESFKSTGKNPKHAEFPNFANLKESTKFESSSNFNKEPIRTHHFANTPAQHQQNLPTSSQQSFSSQNLNGQNEGIGSQSLSLTQNRPSESQNLNTNNWATSQQNYENFQSLQSRPLESHNIESQSFKSQTGTNNAQNLNSENGFSGAQAFNSQKNSANEGNFFSSQQNGLNGAQSLNLVQNGLSGVNSFNTQSGTQIFNTQQSVVSGVHSLNSAQSMQNKLNSFNTHQSLVQSFNTQPNSIVGANNFNTQQNGPSNEVQTLSTQQKGQGAMTSFIIQDGEVVPSSALNKPLEGQSFASQQNRPIKGQSFTSQQNGPMGGQSFSTQQNGPMGGQSFSSQQNMQMVGQSLSSQQNGPIGGQSFTSQQNGQMEGQSFSTQQNRPMGGQSFSSQQNGPMGGQTFTIQQTWPMGGQSLSTQQNKPIEAQGFSALQNRPMVGQSHSLHQQSWPMGGHSVNNHQQNWATREQSFSRPQTGQYYYDNVKYSTNQFNPVGKIPHQIREYEQHFAISSKILSQLQNKVRSARSANLTDSELEFLVKLNENGEKGAKNETDEEIVEKMFDDFKKLSIGRFREPKTIQRGFFPLVPYSEKDPGPGVVLSLGENEKSEKKSEKESVDPAKDEKKVLVSLTTTKEDSN